MKCISQGSALECTQFLLNSLSRTALFIAVKTCLTRAKTPVELQYMQ